MMCSSVRSRVLVGDHLLGDLELAEEEGGAGQGAQPACPRRPHVLVDLGLGVEGRRRSPPRGRCGPRDRDVARGSSGPECKYGAGVGDAEDALALHRADDLAAARLDDHELLGRGAVRRVMSAAGESPGLAPDQAVAPPPQPSRLACARRSAASRPCLAEVRLVCGVMGARRRPPRGARPRRAGCRRSMIASSTRRLRSRSGSRMKYWSRASWPSDQHGPAVPGPAGPCPTAVRQARHGAGEASHERHVEPAHVDAQLRAWCSRP